jgi:hypothetical protein
VEEPLGAEVTTAQSQADVVPAVEKEGDLDDLSTSEEPDREPCAEKIDRESLDKPQVANLAAPKTLQLAGRKSRKCQPPMEAHLDQPASQAIEANRSGDSSGAPPCISRTDSDAVSVEESLSDQPQVATVEKPLDNRVATIEKSSLDQTEVASTVQTKPSVEETSCSVETHAGHQCIAPNPVNPASVETPSACSGVGCAPKAMRLGGSKSRVKRPHANNLATSSCVDSMMAPAPVHIVEPVSKTLKVETPMCSQFGSFNYAEDAFDMLFGVSAPRVLFFYY